MRAVRWILGIAAAVVLLVVAAALIAMLFINPDLYKGEIESAVRHETGRPFVLEGHLRITWFPWLGVRTGAARLGNPPGAVGPDLLDWQSAELRIRVLPLLLHRQLDVGRIHISGADIHLRRGPGGEGNWDDILARLHSGSAKKTASSPGAAGSSSSSAWPARWAGLALENSSLDYVDGRSLLHVSLTDWQLSVGPWRTAEPLSVSTSFALHAGRLGARSSAAAMTTASTSTSTSTTASASASASATTGAAGAFLLPAAGVPVSIDVPRLRIETPEARPLEVIAPRWALRVADAQLEGAIDANRDVAGHVTASGSLTAAVPSLRGLARTLGVGMPEVEDPAALGALQLSCTWSYRDGALAVEPLTAHLDSTTITGWVKYSGSRSAPAPASAVASTRAPGYAWTFALRADQVDFARYLTQAKEQKPLELPVSALRALRARGTLELERARIDGTTLKDVRLQVQ